MRDIKTLLKLVRRKLIWYMLFELCGGLCAVLSDMKYDGVISHAEYAALDKYIEAHKPEGAYGYWWDPWKILPRYRFLSRLIREL